MDGSARLPGKKPCGASGPERRERVALGECAPGSELSQAAGSGLPISRRYPIRVSSHVYPTLVTCKLTLRVLDLSTPFRERLTGIPDALSLSLKRYIVADGALTRAGLG